MVKKKGKTNGSEKEPKEDPNLYFGSGDFTLPNGDVYVGEYCAHRSGLIWRQGHGIYKTQDGQTYEGDWHNDKLIERKEVIITYPNGAQYYGPLLKNKYNGPGTYVLEPNMNVSCEFSSNKPIGTITLIDSDGKLWRGPAKENSALLLPENIFYLNLTEDRGKGLKKEPLEEYVMLPSSSTLTDENKEEELSDREWEKIIFAKSKLTENDVDFTDSDWWTSYEEFRRRYDEIKSKIDNGESLEWEDRVWIQRFKRHKRRRLLKKKRERLMKESEKERVFALNEKFRSKDFTESSPPVKVFYPRNVLDETASQELEQQYVDSEPLITDSENIIVVGSSGEIVDPVAVAPNIEAATDHVSSVLSVSNKHSSTDEDQTVQFNEMVGCSGERGRRLTGSAMSRSNCEFGKELQMVISEDFDLHFNQTREEMLMEKQMEIKRENEREIGAEKMTGTSKDLQATYGKGKSKELNGEIPSKKEGKKEDKAPKSDMKLEKKSTNSLSTRIPLDRKTKTDIKIKECVLRFLKERRERMAEMHKVPMVSIESQESAVHTHDVAAHTESLTGIPRELLLEK